MEMFHDFLPESVWDDRTVVEENNGTRYYQGMPVLVVGLDLVIPVSDMFRGTLGDGGVEKLVHRRGSAGSLQSFPGEDSNVGAGHRAQGAGVGTASVIQSSQGGRSSARDELLQHVRVLNLLLRGLGSQDT